MRGCVFAHAEKMAPLARGGSILCFTPYLQAVRLRFVQSHVVSIQNSATNRSGRAWACNFGTYNIATAMDKTKGSEREASEQDGYGRIDGRR